MVAVFVLFASAVELYSSALNVAQGQSVRASKIQSALSSYFANISAREIAIFKET